MRLNFLMGCKFKPTHEEERNFRSLSVQRVNVFPLWQANSSFAFFVFLAFLLYDLYYFDVAFSFSDVGYRFLFREGSSAAFVARVSCFLQLFFAFSIMTQESSADSRTTSRHGFQERLASGVDVSPFREGTCLKIMNLGQQILKLPRMGRETTRIHVDLSRVRRSSPFYLPAEEDFPLLVDGEGARPICWVPKRCMKYGDDDTQQHVSSLSGVTELRQFWDRVLAPYPESHFYGITGEAVFLLLSTRLKLRRATLAFRQRPLADERNEFVASLPYLYCPDDEATPLVGDFAVVLFDIETPPREVFRTLRQTHRHKLKTIGEDDDKEEEEEEEEGKRKSKKKKIMGMVVPSVVDAAKKVVGLKLFKGGTVAFHSFMKKVVSPADSVRLSSMLDRMGVQACSERSCTNLLRIIAEHYELSTQVAQLKQAISESTDGEIDRLKDELRELQGLFNSLQETHADCSNRARKMAVDHQSARLELESQLTALKRKKNSQEQRVLELEAEMQKLKNARANSLPLNNALYLVEFTFYNAAWAMGMESENFGEGSVAYGDGIGECGDGEGLVEEDEVVVWVLGNEGEIEQSGVQHVECGAGNGGEKSDAEKCNDAPKATAAEVAVGASTTVVSGLRSVHWAIGVLKLGFHRW
ncbi:hypothetical protein G2W53_037327 [Senna tora]|uniref:Uncharacterized protein n=1 Tax=Senna tora TaxID=362788 RepID=A0A834T689_9FABA|nr:hypothetical protein G2W53_037327 [Senna tora]